MPHDPETGLKENAEPRMIGTLLAADTAEEWWAGLPPTTRKGIMVKLLKALQDASSPRDIGTLSRSLMKADELDLKRRQGSAPAVQNNLQVNVQGGPAEMFRALMRELKNGAERNPQEAPAEPAGDDQS